MIEARAASYRYPRVTEPAVDDVTIEIPPGETLAIVGPNGSGKSTFGRLIKALLLPTTGSIVVDGLDTREHGLEVRRRVGLVFQNPTSQIVNAVVEQEIAFGPENLALPPAEVRHRVEAALSAVHLSGMEEAECNTLSMANRQRVAIASALAMDPSYLVLDEPTAWLEPRTRRPVLEEVFRWSRDRGVAIVIATHRMDEAQMCRRVIGMLDGKVDVEGSSADVLRDAAARKRLSLDVPETLHLAESLAERGLPVTLGSSVEELADELCRS
jgi:energy-coupling factor transport system ATP-binding protein